MTGPHAGIVSPHGVRPADRVRYPPSDGENTTIEIENIVMHLVIPVLASGLYIGGGAIGLIIVIVVVVLLLRR